MLHPIRHCSPFCQCWRCRPIGPTPQDNVEFFLNNSKAWEEWAAEVKEAERKRKVEELSGPRSFWHPPEDKPIELLKPPEEPSPLTSEEWRLFFKKMEQNLRDEFWQLAATLKPNKIHKALKDKPDPSDK